MQARSMNAQEAAKLLSKPYGAWRSLVSALVWGTRGPEFKSRRPDEESPANAGLFRYAFTTRHMPPADNVAKRNAGVAKGSLFDAGTAGAGSAGAGSLAAGGETTPSVPEGAGSQVNP
jgi:hypothetical protein